MLRMIINARLNGQATVQREYECFVPRSIDTEVLKQRAANGVSIIMDEMRKSGYDVRQYFIAISYD